MNKLWLFGLCMLFAFGACKPKQSAYKAAYEKAKETESVPVVVENTNEPVAQYTPAPVAKPKPTTTSSSETRVESITALAGEDASRLKSFSVVIGSFTVKTNAYSLKNRMISEGYNAVLGENEQGMLRVIVASFETKQEAMDGRDVFKAKHPDRADFQKAWILERER